MAFIAMVKEGVIVPSAYGAIIFAFFVGWDAAKLRKNDEWFAWKVSSLSRWLQVFPALILPDAF